MKAMTINAQQKSKIAAAFLDHLVEFSSKNAEFRDTVLNKAGFDTKKLGKKKIEEAMVAYQKIVIELGSLIGGK